MQSPTCWIGALALVAAAALPAQAIAQVDITGRWTGVFEFVVLGERAESGPAAMFNPAKRLNEGEPARIGEGAIDVRIANRVGDHFFGRWTVGGQSSELVCTMRDDTEFLCGGRRASAVGDIVDEGAIRLCWTTTGKAASSGCADLARPG